MQLHKREIESKANGSSRQQIVGSTEKNGRFPKYKSSPILTNWFLQSVARTITGILCTEVRKSCAIYGRVTQHRGDNCVSQSNCRQKKSKDDGVIWMESASGYHWLWHYPGCVHPWHPKNCHWRKKNLKWVSAVLIQYPAKYFIAMKS